MEEVYISTDIETDGASPGHYSMLGFASVAFRLDKSIIGTFERNLDLLPGARQDPKVMQFWKDNPEAWAACRKDTVPPAEAMKEYATWLRGLGATPVMVAHPVAFDYTFIHWYLHEFTGGSPLFPAALDITSYAMALMRSPFTKSHKRDMPKEWVDADFPHTHKALDDALGHAMVFCNMVAANQIMMSGPLEFVIHPTGALCEQVLAFGLSSFDRLASYVKSLPYGRTVDADPCSVLREQRGTCSSKHQLLAAVAHECGHFEVQLTVGIYEMSEQNTPGVGNVLSSASLASVPEAHCYLTVGSERFDFTGLSPGTSSPFDTLLEEHIVTPEDLPQTKVRLHTRAIAAWALGAGVSAASAWATREACIAALAANSIRSKPSPKE